MSTKYYNRLQILVICGLLFLCNFTVVKGNNLAITNVSLTNINPATDVVRVKFNISWENSWRLNSPPLNWDASWIFIKYRICASGSGVGNWQHATLSHIASNHTNPTGSTISPSTDGKGVFVYRDSPSSGTFSLTDVQLQWNYGVDGLGDNFEVELRVFGIEMVNIPQGSFSLGSGGTETGAFYKYPTSSNPYVVNSETNLTIQNSSNSLYYPGGASTGDQTGSLSSNWPKGFNSFYVMKYEMSMQQWVDFLNTITSAQAAILSNQPSNGNYGHNISGSWPNYQCSTPDRAQNYLYNVSIMAFLDWSALRPFTEFEFEKICRGPIAPVPNEYIWGQITLHTTAYTVSNSGTSSEKTNLGDSKGNAYCGNNASSSAIRPLRCGTFANDTTTRMESGASYYGVLDLGGNLFEMVVSCGNSAGRSFTGTHGDGNLSSQGYANNTDWPGYISGTSSVTGFNGLGARGGSFGIGSTYMRTSDRYFGYYSSSSADASIGCRGARTAP